MIRKIAQKILELKQKLDEDDKGPTILKSEVVKAIKDMQRKKAMGDNNIPVNLLKESETVD